MLRTWATYIPLGNPARPEWGWTEDRPTVSQSRAIVQNTTSIARTQDYNTEFHLTPISTVFATQPEKNSTIRVPSTAGPKLQVEFETYWDTQRLWVPSGASLTLDIQFSFWVPPAAIGLDFPGFLFNKEVELELYPGEPSPPAEVDKWTLEALAPLTRDLISGLFRATMKVIRPAEHLRIKGFLSCYGVGGKVANMAGCHVAVGIVDLDANIR